MNGFDAVAHEYEKALASGLALAGEPASYFARARVAFLVGELRRLGVYGQVRRILDFGCGTGWTTHELCRAFPCTRALGVDSSRPMIEHAGRGEPESPASFAVIATAADLPDGFDLVYIANVLHHVAPEDRPPLVNRLAGALAPGGVLACFENNPWNPGARAVMARVRFDRDAVPLNVLEARALARGAGLRVASTRSLFYFPRWLRRLRPAEPVLGCLPLGAQHAVLAIRQKGGAPAYSMTRTSSPGVTTMALGTPP